MQWLRYKALFLANRIPNALIDKTYLHRNRHPDGIYTVRIPRHFDFGRILPQINTFRRKIDFVFMLFSLV